MEDVGQFVQRATDVATFVTTQSGALVTTEFQQSSSGGAAGLSLRLGSPGLSTDWRFPQTTDGQGSKVTFLLANPGPGGDGDRLLRPLGGAVTPRRLSIPPLSVVDFSVRRRPGFPTRSPTRSQSTPPAPIVAGRLVFAGGGCGPPVGLILGNGHPGHALAGPRPRGHARPGDGPRRSQEPGRGQSGRGTAQVEVARLGGSSGGPVRGGARTIGRPRGQAGRQSLTYSVMASLPVGVEEDSRPSGASGVVSSTGFPFIG